MSSKGKVIDFSNVDSLTAIPSGRYSAVVVDVEEKISDSSGHPYYSWTFEVTSGEFKGRKLWNNTSLQEQALWKLKETLEALGIDCSKKVEFQESAMAGLRCDLIVGIRVYDEKDRNDVKQILPSAGGTSTGRKAAAGAGKKKTSF